ncbi:MAG TPA: GFA family protein [Caulobacteraceae bacterium]|jgi:hypothetical protein
MLEGACHCGAVHWRLDAQPELATACSCSTCRRYGVLWAYGFHEEDLHVTGPTSVYLWGRRSLGFHFCPACGCLAYWRSVERNDAGHLRGGVNLRLCEAGAVAEIPVEHLDGAGDWKEVHDGRRVKDMWF